MKKLLLSSAIFLLLSPITYSQIFWKIAADAGIYESIDNEDSESSPEASFDGTVGFRFKDSSGSGLMKLRVNPEILGLTERISSLRIKGDGNFLHKMNNFDLGLTISGNKYSVSKSGAEFNYNYYLISVDFIKSLSRTQTIISRIGYSGIDAKNGRAQSGDNQFISVRASDISIPRINFSYGIYLEKFHLEENIQFLVSDKLLNGTKAGLELSASYLGSVYAKADYRFLLLNTKITQFKSTENYLRLAAGKNLTTNLTAMVLVDAYFQNLKYKQNISNENKIILPGSFENRIFGKLNFALKKDLDFYIKTGYSKLIYNSTSSKIEGWNISVGVEITKN